MSSRYFQVWTRQSAGLWPILGTAVLMLLLWFYLSLSQRFPFEMAWDMDTTAVHDALLINSGKFPLHLDHPKFAMHLITGWALRLGRALELISVVDFSELKQSPSPMLCLAELTLFLRAVEAVFMWLSLILGAGLLRMLFPGRGAVHVITLLLLGLQIGLLYCCAVMRTEAYSIFLLLLGMFLFCFLLLRHGRSTEIWAWLLAGLCFGLALLTKLQAIMAAPFMLAFCGYVYSRLSPSDESNPRLSHAFVLPLLGVSLLILLGLAWQSWRMPSLPGQIPVLLPVAAWQSGELSIGQFLGHLKLQAVWIVLAATVPVSLLLSRRKGAGQRLFQFYPLFWCGLSLAFVLPSLSFLGHPEALSRGWQFMLQMAQTCFWTDTQASTTSEAGVLFKTLSFALLTDKNYLLLALAVVIVAAYHYYRVRDTAEARGFVTAALLLLAGTGGLLLGSRATLRDTIWFEFLGLLGIMILFNQIWGGLKLRSLKILLGLCLLVSTSGNVMRVPTALDQIYLYFAPFRTGEFWTLVSALYARPKMDYPNIMLAAYADGMPKSIEPRAVLRKAVEQARLARPLQQLADLPFLNLRLPMRALGLAEPGFAVWRRDEAWARFTWIEPTLRGSVLVNPLVIDARPGPIQWLAMNDRADLSERHLRASGGEHLSLLPNTDIRMLFCLSRSDAIALLGEDALVGEPAAKVGLADQNEAYYAFWLRQDQALQILVTISGYSEFNRTWLASLKYPPFFLIHHGNDWGPVYPTWSNLESRLKTNRRPEN